jgi:predicted DNA-binding transcriptional regulator AlpA
MSPRAAILDAIRGSVGDVLAIDLSDSQTTQALLKKVNDRATLRQLLTAALSVARERQNERTADTKSGSDTALREPRRMLTEAQVLDLLPFGRTTLHGLIKNGGFPRGIYVSPNRRVWFADQIAAWQRALEASNPNFNPNRGRGHGRRPRLSVAKGS